jgi:hypothetical protein
MTWKQLYAQAMARQGAMQDVLRRSVVAAQQCGRPELIRRLNSDRSVPLYTLCATLDACGIAVPDEASALITTAASNRSH